VLELKAFLTDGGEGGGCVTLEGLNGRWRASGHGVEPVSNRPGGCGWYDWGGRRRLRLGRLDGGGADLGYATCGEGWVRRKEGEKKTTSLAPPRRRRHRD
jgi:hypothetical protein